MARQATLFEQQTAFFAKTGRVSVQKANFQSGEFRFSRKIQYLFCLLSWLNLASLGNRFAQTFKIHSAPAPDDRHLLVLWAEPGLAAGAFGAG
jgi:hypothetical protein